MPRMLAFTRRARPREGLASPPGSACLWDRMSTERSRSKPGIPGKTGTNSSENPEPDSPQLSGEGRVNSNVSSVAMNAGFLGLGGVGRPSKGNSAGSTNPLQSIAGQGPTDA